MFRMLGLVGLIVLCAMGFAASETPRTVLLFPFEIHDTSGEPPHTDRASELKRVGDQLADALDRSGRYRVISARDSPVANALPASVLRCGGCARTLGRKAGADIVALAMIQKMSSLVLFMEVALQDVATGAIIAQDRVSLRGDNEESFRRAMDWLLRHRLLPEKT